MPLITAQELGNLCPPFSSKAGQMLCRLAMRVLSVDELNDLYDSLSSNKGPEFARAFLDNQKIAYTVGGAENIEKLPEGAFITISNHPYGHVDGISIIDLFGHLRPDYKVMVNSILMRIQAMDENFVSVIPTGKIRTAPRPESILGVKTTLKHLQDGHPMGFFPSGAVSDLSLREGCIRDRGWQEPVLRLIQRAKVPIVPVRFFDRNSNFYYSLGLISSSVRLLRLPSEALNKSGKPLRIGIGKIISVEEQSAYKDLSEYGKMLRNSVYGMPLPDNFIGRDELFK